MKLTFKVVRNLKNVVDSFSEEKVMNRCSSWTTQQLPSHNTRIHHSSRETADWLTDTEGYFKSEGGKLAKGMIIHSRKD